jgi:hypothetical protein
MNLLTSAKNYANKGLSVISTDNIKRSIPKWKDYQSKIATEHELEHMFSHPKVKGLAVIAGAISGNLEIIDVDCKYGIKWEEYSEKILDADPVLYGKLKIIKTVSNGYHIYYKCETIEGNQKLAERPATDEELTKSPMAKQYVLIETRGEGGYVCAPPTTGYQPLDSNDIPIITIDERDILLSIARSFTQVIENNVDDKNTDDNYEVTIWDDFNNKNNVIKILEDIGWKQISIKDKMILLRRPGQTSSATSGVYFTDTKIFFPHTTSSQFRNVGYTAYSITKLIKYNDNTAACLKDLQKKGYGKIKEEPFWNPSTKVINRYDLQKWLHRNYCQLYFLDKPSGVYRLISNMKKRVKEVYPVNVKEFIIKYFEERWADKEAKKKDKDSKKVDIELKKPLLPVVENIIKNASSLFSDNFFEFIDEAKLETLKDTKTTAYFPFEELVIKITADTIEGVNYDKIEQSVWENQINEFKIIIDNDYSPENTEFYQFISLISNNEIDRIEYAISAIGYILHSYKDPTRPYAIILAEETDDESKGGGTGKGIFFKAISKVIPVVTMDGKNFKPDKTFAWSRVQLGTKLVVIEDCPKNVEFERYYPTITEGMTVEKKNKDEFFIKFDDSPKLSFTTNYSIASNSEHSKRRQRVIEFAPFFNSKNTPEMKFGKLFFDGWGEGEWQKFYNFMFYCVKYYLQNGIKDVGNSDKMKNKKIKQQFGEEFLEYFLDLPGNVFKFISDEWKGFLEKYELDKKEYSLKRFKKALEIGSKIYEIEYIDRRNQQHNGLKEFCIKKNNDNYVQVINKDFDMF